MNPICSLKPEKDRFMQLSYKWKIAIIEKRHTNSKPSRDNQTTGLTDRRTFFHANSQLPKAKDIDKFRNARNYANILPPDRLSSIRKPRNKPY